MNNPPLGWYDNPLFYPCKDGIPEGITAEQCINSDSIVPCYLPEIISAFDFNYM